MKRLWPFVVLVVAGCAHQVDMGTPSGVLESARWQTFVRVVQREFESSVDRDVLDAACREALRQRTSVGGDAVDHCITTALARIDPSAKYTDPDAFRQRQRQLDRPKGAFGLEVPARKNRGEPVRVVSTIKGTPADRAGIREGDLLVSIDGIETAPLSNDDALALTRGQPGSIARVQVQRGAEKVDIRVEREEIRLSFAKFERFPGRAVYCRIWQLRDGEAASQFYSKATSTLRSETVAPLVFILDLRNSTGGSLNEAIAVASFFVPPDTKLFALSVRDGIRTVASPRSVDSVPVRSQATDVFLRTASLFVLVNGMTSGNAEMLAQALRLQRGAKIVGTPTAGQNGVQRYWKIDDQAAITLTEGRFLTPAAEDWSRRGVPIDIEVPESHGHEFGELPHDATVSAVLSRLSAR